MPQFYRIIQHREPTIADFLSAARKKRPPAPDTYPEGERAGVMLWVGISVYSTAPQARRKARGVPTIGQYIAELLIPEDGTITYIRTTKSSGHYTLWGRPADIMACVKGVEPVEDFPR